jgi:two-component system, cell cycle response regulator
VLATGARARLFSQALSATNATCWIAVATVVGEPRIVLVDVSAASRDVMVRRLSAQGYIVESAGDPISGAEMALSAPPQAVVADFWMPAISGIQLCRLLRTEPATSEVPVILRGDEDDPRNRFWAERAGAAGYVRKGRMGDLVRMLERVRTSESSAFFFHMGAGASDIRERIAKYLDAALFESVIAAEVRSLSACGSFERLFDLFAQFLSQVVRYRWLALSTHGPRQFAVHHHPANENAADLQARTALELPDGLHPLRFVDEDAHPHCDGPPVITCSVPFGGSELGRLAIAPIVANEPGTDRLISLVGRELGGPVRIATLMDEHRRLATIDPLTGLHNRRAFLELLRAELERADRYELPLSLMLLDVDHFKAINDRRGHGAGDQVLCALGLLLRRELRQPDISARWGGEEFVVALPDTDATLGEALAERLCAAVQALDVPHAEGPIPVTASFGLATYRLGESPEALIDRADRAMYSAKASGRNRVSVAQVFVHSPGTPANATG